MTTEPVLSEETSRMQPSPDLARAAMGAIEVPDQDSGAVGGVPAFMPRTADEVRVAPAPTSREAYREPRTASLANTVWRLEGKSGYVIPDQEVMATITAETKGKVQYWPAEHAERPTEPSFDTEVMEPLCAELVRRFPDKRLALRGVMTSVNGHLKDGFGVGENILDITETMQAGAEKPDAVFNVQGLSADGDTLSVYRVSQYAFQVGRSREFGVSPEVADAVFPAILVYDCDGLQRMGGHYGVSFKPDHAPNEVLLAGYILDAPAFR